MAYNAAMSLAATHFSYITAHGPVTLEATERGLRRVAFAKVRLEGPYGASAITNAAASQLQEYLAGKRRAFDVPLDIAGSDFQRQVWDAVAAIPYGTTATAAQVAAQLGRPGSFRSVGAALRAVSLAPFLPAHRVAGSAADGQLARIYQGFLALEGAC